MSLILMPTYLILWNYIERASRAFENGVQWFTPERKFGVEVIQCVLFDWWELVVLDSAFVVDGCVIVCESWHGVELSR